MKGLSLLLAALLCAAPPAFAPASAPSASPEGSDANSSAAVGFYVHAQIPENQRNTHLSYFDLAVEPGARQTLAVDVVNETQDAIRVAVRTVSASTSRYGAIDYITPDVHDDCLALPFSGLAKPQKEVVTVPAGESATALVELSLPRERFEGVVLGGIVFTQLPPEEAAQSHSDTSEQTIGAQINNKYSYVIGALLTETENGPPPAFELAEIRAELVENRGTPVHYIRNRNPALVKNMALAIDIRRTGAEEALVHLEKQGISMAPSSVMPYAPVMPEQALEAGRYTSTVTLRLDGRTWTLKRDFIITRDEAVQINEQVVLPQRAALPVWVIVLVVVLALLSAALAVYILMQRKGSSGGGHS